MSFLDAALHFGGFVLARAAWIASEIEEGELICPFVVVTRGDSREVVPFESDSQAKSIEMGKASFNELKSSVDGWALAREGLYSVVGGDSGKKDVINVSLWVEGLDEPVILQQLFKPNSSGHFALIGEIGITIHGVMPQDEIQSRLRQISMQGVAQHPHGSKWNLWSEKRS